MEMTSLLIICVLWAENPRAAREAGPAPAAATEIDDRANGDAEEPQLAPAENPPRADRYGRVSGQGVEAAEDELERTEAEAQAIAAEGGPDMLGGAGGKPAAKKTAAPKRGPGPAAPAPRTRNAETAGQAPLAPIQAPPVKAGEADALIRSLTTPNELALPGVATRLADLMSRLVDRRQQIEVTQTYWKLSASVGEYRIAADCFHRLQQLVPPADATGQAPVDPLVDARLSAAEARLREAEADVLGHQYALAEASHWPSSGELPLPTDAPLTSGYNTRFDRVYGNAPPPPRAVLIDRSLPLRHRSIEMRAAAVTAASHAAEGDFDAYVQEKVDLTIVLESINELARQQRAFVVVVRDYNRDIAEYALSIAPPGLANEKLIGMLLGTPGSAATRGQQDSSLAEQPEGVRRAGFDQPNRTRIRSAGPASEPSLAPREIEAPSAAGEQRPLEEDAEPGAQFSAPTPLDEPNVPLGPGGEPAKPVNPFEKQAHGARAPIRSKPYSARKPQLDAAAADEAPAGLYPALVDLKPPQRTQELGSALHWARQLPADFGAPVSLAECLSWSGGDRRSVIEVYWQTCHRAARYQAIAEQAGQLGSLDPAALRWRSQVDGAEAMLRLKAAERAAQADLVEAELDLRVGQFMLAQLGSRPLKGLWPLPSTAPHAGRYLLKIDSLPAEIRRLPSVQRTAAMTSALYEALEVESAAVVKADLVRASATARYEQGAATISEPLDAIRDQLEETLAFLKVQTDYNLQYAGYVLAVLPPGSDRQLLAKALALH